MLLTEREENRCLARQLKELTFSINYKLYSAVTFSFNCKKNAASKEEMFYTFWSLLALEVTFCWQTRLGVDLVEPVQLKRNIPFSFARKVLLTRAYTNGLTAELNSISVWVTAYVASLILTDVLLCKLCTITSGAQQIPNIAVTVTPIKVTRFRTLRTPWIYREKYG